MKAYGLTIVGLVSLAAGMAEAESLSSAPLHGSKRSTHPVSLSKSGNVNGVGLSDPYGSPVRVPDSMIARFTPIRSSPPVEPQGGLSINAGRESPDAPFTGGLKLRF